MSTDYKNADEVPSETLCKRLDELATAITNGKQAIDREFTMRVPAEVDRDPDLVLGAAAHRISSLEQQIKLLESQVAKREYRKYEFCKAVDCLRFRQEKCVASRDAYCVFTAKEFHHWLNGDGFKIVKAGRGDGNFIKQP